MGLWFDLISKLICLSPKDRLTAEKALEHPFFAQEPLPVANSELLPQSLKDV
jgi:serine/threonine protein kinase